MQAHRVTSLLEGIATARGWLTDNIPLTRTMAGYELFLRIASDSTAGRPIVLGALLAALRHPEDVLQRELATMQAAGLLEAQPGGADPRQRVFAPSARFLDLLQDFGRRFDSLFILRKNLRDPQLLTVTQDADLRALAERLYDHFYDLGWFYLHNFGAACFLMASLVARVAQGYGYQARIASCYVDVARGEQRYLLGAEGYAKPGQIDGHAVCIVDETLLIDFGLGNARRNFRRDFPWAIACEYRRHGATMGGIVMPTMETVVWKDDWQSPGTAAELARYAPHLDELYLQYETTFR